MGKNKRKRKKLPPEEFFKTPEEYYQGEILRDYVHSKSKMRIQEKITKRALEIAEIPNHHCLILDIGMGCGFSTSYLYLNNFKVVGVDLIYNMLTEYDIRELNPVNADMKDLPFRNNSFDFIFSISAFQWIINKLESEERNRILKNIAKCLNSLLKRGGKVIIQFYPLKQELLKEIGAIFADYGDFKGNIIIDNPNSGVKKKYFYILRKKY